MGVWKVTFKTGKSRTVNASGRYEAVIKVGVLLGYGGHSSAWIVSQVQSVTKVTGNPKGGRPRGPWWN